jgi:ABC-type nitrate/sulfonate/bicarbonate transport system substrate-binding protein
MNCILRKIIPVLLLGLFLLIASQADAVTHEKAETVTLQLKWTHQFNFAGYYAAKEKGYYRDAGLDVLIKEGTPGTNFVDEVVSGRAQYGIEMPELLLERHKGKPVVVLAAIFQHSPQILLVLQESGISSPQGVVGRKIMVRKDSSCELMAMLRKEGVAIEQLDITELSWNLNDLIEK